MAMAVSDNKVCHDTVEVTCEAITLGGDPQEKPLVLAAAEIIMPAGITGRIKMHSVDTVSKKSVGNFLKSSISPGSSLILDDQKIIQQISKDDFIAVVSTSLYRTREIIKSFEIWINKTHRGGVAAKHLQLYLDEFCFRRNAEMLPSSEAVFDLLLSGVISKKSLSYKTIISQSGKE